MKIVNKEELAVGDMNEDRLERKALPIGKTQFFQWADRIIDGAAVEGERDSLRNALAGMLMQIGPTEAFREDAYFMLALRTAAVKQTGHYMHLEFKEAREKKLAEASAPTPGVVDGAVLAKKDV